MGAVADFVGDAVGGAVDAVGDVAGAVVNAAGDVVNAVGKAAETVVQSAVNDPIGTLAKAAAIATGNPELLPLISAADVVAHGGNLEQAAISAGATYIGQGVANYVATDLATAEAFDTTPFSEQTRTLASGVPDLVPPSQLANAIGAGAGGTARTLITTGDLEKSLKSGLTGGIGSYVGQEIKADTGDLLGKTGSTIAGNVAGATTAGMLMGQNPSQVFGSSLVNNLINVNLANMSAGKGDQPAPTQKADTPSAIVQAYNSLNDLDKTFVNTAVMTGTDLETAVNYAMANPTMSTSMKEGVQYASLDNGIRTDAGNGAMISIKPPSDASTVEAPPVSGENPEFKYNSDGSIDELQADGSYKKIDDIKLDETGKILTKEGDNWVDTGTYAKGTEAMRAGGDSQYSLSKEELSKGYTYASDGSMRTPEGNYYLKIYGTSDSSPQLAYETAPDSVLDKAMTKVGGLLGLGGGDPNATYRALFGGGAYSKGLFDASAGAPIGWGTKEANEAVKYMEVVLQDKNATPQEKQIALQTISKINSGAKGGGEPTTGGAEKTAGGDTGGAPSTSGATSSNANSYTQANYISTTVKSLADSGYKNPDIATLLKNTFGLDSNTATNLVKAVTTNGTSAGNDFLLMSSTYTGTNTSGTGAGAGGTGAGSGTGATTGTGTGTGTGTTTGGGTSAGTGTGTGTGAGDATGTGGTGTAGSGTGSGTGTGSGSGTGAGGAGGSALSTASQALSYGTSGGASSGSSTGALPKGLNATYLSAAPIQETEMNLGQLKQLYPQLSGVDPKLLNILQGRSYAASPLGGATGLSGGNLITPSPGFPSRASGQEQTGVAAFTPTNDLMNNSYDALSAAGLRSLGALPSSGSVYGLKKGGKVHNRESAPHIPEFITGKTGHYVDGKGDGQSDDIPAMLADGEYVFDADTVSALGNGSSKAGAQLLDHFRESLREHKRSAPNDKIPPASSPLAYMKEALKRHKG